MKMSEERQNIVAALLKVQSELQNPKRTEENPYFKSRYAPLDQILRDVREVLTRHGLILLQDTGADDEGKVNITTTIIHESGEWVATSPLTVQPRGRGSAPPTPQDIGSAITYARRYQLMSLLGIAAEDEDDDGAKASNTTKKPRPMGRTRRPPTPQKELKDLDPDRYNDKVTKALIIATRANKGRATLENVLTQLEEYYSDGRVTDEQYTKIKDTLGVEA